MSSKEEFALNLNGTSFSSCSFRATRYQTNGNLALQIVDAEGLVATCSVNPGVDVDNDHLCVKDYSENTGMLKFLIDKGVVEKPEYGIPSGWVTLFVCPLTESGKELWVEEPRVVKE